jgi:hypothetical protein
MKLLNVLCSCQPKLFPGWVEGIISENSASSRGLAYLLGCADYLTASVLCEATYYTTLNMILKWTFSVPRFINRYPKSGHLDIRTT